jgi:hypothetical protein
VSAVLAQILDAVSRLTSKHPSQLSDEELRITCGKSDPNFARFLREFIVEFGEANQASTSLADSTITKKSGDTHVSSEVQRLEKELAAAKQRAQVKYRPGEIHATVVNDASGRPITSYRGDPNACWDQFNPGVRYIRGFNTPGRR